MNDNIAIIGAGNSGLTMAAYLSLNGHKVRLWNRSENTIESLQKTRIIKYSGIINGEVKINLVSNDIKKVISNAKWIFITTPADSHYEIAHLLAPIIEDKSIIVLSPGRTFGILEIESILKEHNKNNIVAETQTIIFTCRKESSNTVNLLEIKNNVLLATLRIDDTEKVLNELPVCIRANFLPANSFFETSLGNVGMILHVAPLLLNTGWVENEETEFKYYYNGITPTIAHFLEKLDNERLEVAKKLNIKVYSLIEWFDNTYNVKAKTIYDCINQVNSYRIIDAPKTLNHRYVYEDISTGLVPLASLGTKLGLDMKLSNLIIDLATELLDYDFRKNGRDISKYDLTKYLNI